MNTRFEGKMWAGDPRPDDRLFICAVRLSAGEFPFMRDAVGEASDTMNRPLGETCLVADVPVADIPDSDFETALRALGVWHDDLIRAAPPRTDR